MAIPASGSDADSALFVADGGDVVVPTDRARGPWSPRALHGGPVAALVARAAEGQSHDDLQLARITLELLRPVPLAPLRVTSARVKPGRKAQIIDTVIEAAGLDVAWSRALLIRHTGEDQRVGVTVPEDEAPESPGDLPSTPLVIGEAPAFHNAGVEMRYVKGRPNHPGPATVWFRLQCAVVAGEDPTPWQRAAAAADFGNGVAAELAFESSVFINPDLTLSLHRPPVGEWVCLDARTRFGGPGIGAAESALWDVEGRIGRAVQSLIVEIFP